MKLKKIKRQMLSALSIFALSFIFLTDQSICFFIFHQPEFPEECRKINSKRLWRK